MTRRAAAAHLQAAADELAHVLRDPPDERLRRWLAGMIAAVVDKRDELTDHTREPAPRPKR